MHISTEDGAKFTLIAQTDEDRFFIGALAKDGHATFLAALPTPTAMPAGDFTHRGCTLRVSPSLLACAVRAEAFVAGFEDDATQEGVSGLLGDLRAAIGAQQDSAQ